MASRALSEAFARLCDPPTVDQGQLWQPLPPGREALLEVFPRAEGTVDPVGVPPSSAPDGAAVGCVAPLDEHDGRQVGHGDDFLHSRHIEASTLAH
jgi:hypothetical protein